MIKKFPALLLVLLLCATAMAACSGKADKPPKDPNAIATVITGETVTVITDAAQFEDAVDPSGNSVVKFWKDLNANTTIILPYSCTLDLNGHSVLTKAGASCTIEVNKAGEENAVTTLQNGTIEHYGIGLRIKGGGFVIDSMTFNGVSGEAIVLTDTSYAEKGTSAVKNSQFYSYGSSFLSFQSGGSFQSTDITLDNCTVILYRPKGASIFAKENSETVPATILFGENVNLYSYGSSLAAEGFYYAGNLVPAANETKSVTVKDDTYDGLTFWSTENEDNAMNLLMIGNSFSYYYVQELYGMAHEAGVEINVTNLYEAGCYSQEHYEWLTNEVEGAGKYQFWITNSMGRWRHGQITASYDALEYLDWDVITLQQYLNPSITKSYENAMETCTPYVKDTYDILKERCPNAKLYWHAHWTFQVGHSSMPDSNKQRIMQDTIHKVSQTLAEENNVPIIPTGDAWAIARNDSAVGDNMCKSDKYHDGDTGGGQYLNAAVWLEVLTGKSCIGNSWRPNYLLSERTISALQEAAHQAVAAMYGADFAK